MAFATSRLLSAGSRATGRCIMKFFTARKAAQWILNDSDSRKKNIHWQVEWLVKSLTMPRVAQERPRPDLQWCCHAHNYTVQHTHIHTHTHTRVTTDLCIVCAWIRTYWVEPHKACILSFQIDLNDLSSEAFFLRRATRHLALQQAPQQLWVQGASLRPWALRWGPGDLGSTRTWLWPWMVDLVLYGFVWKCWVNIPNEIAI